MYFKRMEMQGFKSFADPVTIDFNDGVTCIIGPNGSGKSNISDALRWVVGEQSSKQLRGSKMQDVIFAGTNTRKPKGMAEVTLVIDNTSGTLPIEYSEVAVTRRMYRSGESEYLINGNQCRLKDIKELFMDTGIGVDGYSIIGQGKIADIVSTKPENRRQIFEEAAGVVLYKSRKTDAEHKLKAANDNLERVRDIISEIEGRIDGLKEDSDKASEYIVLRDRYKKLGINIILHNLESLEKSVNNGREELVQLENKLAEMSSEYTGFDEIIESKRVLDAELNESLADSNEKLLAKIEELNTISNSGQLNTEKLNNIERELERLNNEISDAQFKLDEETAALKELELKDESLNSEKSEYVEEHNNAVIKLNEDVKNANSVNDEIENSKDRIIELNNKSVAKKAEITTLSNYRVTLAERQDALKEDIDGKDAREKENKILLDEISNKLDAKNSEITEFEYKLKEVNDNIISANKKISDFSASIDENTIKINQLSARKSTIEEMESNYEGYNNAVKSLMHKSFRGIIGTVSELIDVPDGYETAIETALGGNLQNIICEDDASAKAAIEWLKSSKAGRATFLPVASVKADKIPIDEEAVNSKGYIGIASELIKCDSKYQEIYDYLLCRVIIADNMDNAIKLSKLRIGGYRIVTLEGELINSNGAITGGKFSHKSANLLDRKKEIASLADEIEGLKSDVERLKSDRTEARDNLTLLENERASVVSDIQELNIEFNVLKIDKEHAEERLKEVNAGNNKLDAEIKTIDEDIARATAMIEKYQAEIDSNGEEAGKLEKAVDCLLTKRDELKAVVEHDNEAIVSLKLKITEQETKILSQNELVERIKDSITDIEDALNENTYSRNELENQRNLLTSTGAESYEKLEILKNEKTELEQNIESITASIDKNKAEYEESIRDQKNLNQEIDRIRDEKFKLDIKTEKNETLLDTQKDKLWDEFEVSYAEALDMKEPDFGITAGNKESKEIRLRMAELGDVNISAIDEYKQVSKRYEFMTAQEADTSKAMRELEEIIKNMDRTIKAKFKETFDEVVVNFEKSFKELFGGGHAELRLEDENNPLESGVEITAQPPGKKLKNINLLSGGEKTLTAIALMFAVLKSKPTPFCILDEVEAALDEVNIERFSDYLQNFRDIQFALITHQKATMEHADVLYGVTMPEQGISKMLSLKLGDNFDAEGLE